MDATGRKDQEILNSWKEIATYLGRGVRTVQRWEVELGLPVRRPYGRDHSTVVALSAEIDEWVRRSPFSARPSRKAPPVERMNEARFAEFYALMQQAREIQANAELLRNQLRESIVSITESVRKIAARPVATAAAREQSAAS